MANAYNFQNKTFLLVENAANGTVNQDTIFKYQQNGDLVTADYKGGTVIYGKIIARLQGDQLLMRYQCLTIENTFKVGKAIAQITQLPDGKLQLSLDWEWIDGGIGKGQSIYIESAE